jgi:predicted membrane protein
MSDVCENYQSQASLIILELNELIRIIEPSRYSEKEEKKQKRRLIFLYYWLSVLFYNLNDYPCAINNLKKCLDNAEPLIEKKNKKTTSRGFLNFILRILEAFCLFIDNKTYTNHIWKVNIKPSVWSYWFNSPEYLSKKSKRIIGVVLFLLLFGHFSVFAGHFILLKSTVYLIKAELLIPSAVIILLFIFVPILASFKSSVVEMEFLSPAELDITPVEMESMLAKLEATEAESAN